MRWEHSLAVDWCRRKVEDGTFETFDEAMDYLINKYEDALEDHLTPN